jgi:hypothetical protein
MIDMEITKIFWNLLQKTLMIWHPKIKGALFETGIDLAEMIQSSLVTKENLKTADAQYSRSTTPVGVDRNASIVCPEILGWAIAILAVVCKALCLSLI